MNRFQSWYGAQPRALRALLTINVVVYVFWILLFGRIEPTARFVMDHVAFTPGLPGILLEPWQLVTYNFLHLGAGLMGFIHILFNLLWLYWIGRDHEDLHGPRALVALYLITGVGGGLLTVVLHAIFPDAAFFRGPIHGASASVLGVMAAVATLYPYKKIGLLFLGAVRLVYIVIAFLVLDLLFLSGGGTAVGAHLGGALFGFLFVRVEQKGIDLTSWTRIFFRERRPRRTAPREEEEGSLLKRIDLWLASRNTEKESISSKNGGSRRQARSPLARIRSVQTATAEEEPIENEVDRILDKISAHGMDSLTDEERRILHEASRQ